MTQSARTLGPVVAGTWYPGDRERLTATVRSLVREARTANAGWSHAGPIALIAPHAGYRYSGEVAGAAFGLVEGRRVRRVLLLGPSHHAAYRGAVLPSSDAYATPLGPVPFDADARGALAGLPGFRADDGPFLPEHSLEMEIPFLQAMLEPGWHLVPVLLGGVDAEHAMPAVAEGLRPLVDEETLIVASSDFTHYGAAFGYVPFRDAVPERIRELDMGALERILALDEPGFGDYVRRTGATICGHHAIHVLLRLVPGAAATELVRYDTSGRMTGDWSHCVSYAAVAFVASDDGAGERPCR